MCVCRLFNNIEFGANPSLDTIERYIKNSVYHNMTPCRQGWSTHLENDSSITTSRLYSADFSYLLRVCLCLCLGTCGDISFWPVFSYMTIKGIEFSAITPF
jgi:hypothetical protein